ncbi:hypothetical protein VQH23_26530 (plasmid) [Pararoseomonas sp. SCSIO 73927]|uniref:hypothetical protein n=1 Tax=Pararoseomonas sp. SCSIO 73927 TaxID=3114537 RepID=UPI0030CE5242
MIASLASLRRDVAQLRQRQRAASAVAVVWHGFNDQPDRVVGEIVAARDAGAKTVFILPQVAASAEEWERNATATMAYLHAERAARAEAQDAAPVVPAAASPPEPPPVDVNAFIGAQPPGSPAASTPAPVRSAPPPPTGAGAVIVVPH